MKKNGKNLLQFIIVVCMLLVMAPGKIEAAGGSALDVATIKSPSHDQIMQQLLQNEAVRLVVALDTSVSSLSTISALDAEVEYITAVDKIQATFLNSFTQNDVTVLRLFEYSPSVLLTVETPEAYDMILTSDKVVSVFEDVPIMLSDYVSAPAGQRLPMAQAVPVINADDAHGENFDGDDWAVAILDTGVDKDHHFLDDGKVIHEACFSTTYAPDGAESLCPGGASSSTVVGSAEPYGNGVCDVASGACDHGTHVAGIAAGDDPSFESVAPDANLIAVLVFSGFNDGLDVGSYPSDQVAALEYLYSIRNDYAIASINLSLGGSQFFSSCDLAYPAYTTIVQNLKAAKIATVIAAGNNGFTDSVAFPACISDAITVGATYDSSGTFLTVPPTPFSVDEVTYYSNAGIGLIDFWAPGSFIISSVPTESNGSGAPVEEKDGTSMAAPMVAGAWAVLMHAYPTATVDEIAQLFADNGVTVVDDSVNLLRTGGGTTAPRIDFSGTLDDVLAVPVYPMAPASGTVTSDHTPNLDWNDVPGAESYNIQISPTIDFTVLPIDQYKTVSWMAPGVAMINQQYWWRVRVRISGVWSDWSRVRSFTIVGAPGQPAPTPLGPDDGATTDDHTPTFTWTAVPTAAQYRIHISKNANFFPVIVNQIAPTNEWTPGVWMLSGTYYWRVQAMGGGDVSWFTPRRVLTIID